VIFGKNPPSPHEINVPMAGMIQDFMVDFASWSIATIREHAAVC